MVSSHGASVSRGVSVLCAVPKNNPWMFAPTSGAMEPLIAAGDEVTPTLNAGGATKPASEGSSGEPSKLFRASLSVRCDLLWT